MEQRVLVLAPGGRDAEVAEAVLREVGIGCTVCATLADLVEELSAGAGAAVIVEEALAKTDPATLLDWIERQPPWSELPFIMLTKAGMRRSGAAAALLRRLGNPMLLERPLTAETLASAARSAVRARQRQREHAQAEEQLRQAQKMEAIGQFTGGVAHDFNNLLTTIIGNLELLLRPATNPEHTYRFLMSAQRAADRGAQLTATLLAFARRQTLCVTTVDPNALVTDFGMLIGRAVGETIALEMSLDPEVLPCRADGAQLQAAILNLAINARDAMPEGGSLALTTRNVVLAATDLIGNADARPGPFVAVAVRDTGSGMPAHVLARAFEPFYTTKEIGKGTGLGLSQVYGFVRQSGGHVAIQTAKGGTTVTLYLPASDPLPAPSLEVSECAPAVDARNGATVLVVEDDESVLELTSVALSGAGYRILVARDGRQALTLLQNDETIELIFSDVVMPQGMSGIELGRTARALRPGVKVLLTSGYAGAALDHEGAAGEFEILAKPYHQAQLAARVAAALSAARIGS
jgi:signal transduction histidine kinase/ActR/RegA family two-component response regulator